MPGLRQFALLLLALAAALSLAAAVESGDGLWLGACALGATGLVALVAACPLEQLRLSVLDAVMAGSATGALAAELEASTPTIVAVAGVAAGIALNRWRPERGVLAAAVGLAALAVDPLGVIVAAPAFAVAAARPGPAATPGPEFSPVVLVAILVYASVSLVLLTVGQFEELDNVAVALAGITVLAGMARAGLTVVDRLRESHRQAITDDLTGLANRRHLLDRLEAAIAAASAGGDELALLLVDLDGFKELNDTLGHPAGDEVLRQIGPRLQDLLREHDTLARLGGDEFAVVLAPGDDVAASAAALRLRSALERSFQVADIRLHIDASVGIALFPQHATDPLGLLQRADVAMYEAKRLRTGHEVYLASRDHHSRQRLALIGELHGALEAGELVVHYQPKANLDSGAVHGVEALVRWEHPVRGLLGPSEFLPLMEQSGLTRSLTGFVLDRALEEIAPLGVGVAVNLGPADLLDLGLPSEVGRLLALHDVAAERLQLEVSEDVVMADVQRTADVLAGLRSIGVSTALDDFGAGHAALGHLRELNVDTLKIDRAFVMRLTRDDRDDAIVHTLVDLGRRLGLQVVAEGVETVEAWTLLAAWRCDEAQGHFISRPMPAGDLAAWLAALPDSGSAPSGQRR